MFYSLPMMNDHVGVRKTQLKLNSRFTGLAYKETPDNVHQYAEYAPSVRLPLNPKTAPIMQLVGSWQSYRMDSNGYFSWATFDRKSNRFIIVISDYFT